jgi:hypothetical protein
LSRSRVIRRSAWINHFELLKDPFHLQIFQRLIDNNAHGTLVVILADIDKIVPEPRNPEIRLDKPVMLGGPLAEDRGFILHTSTCRFSSGLLIIMPMAPSSLYSQI